MQSTQYKVSPFLKRHKFKVSMCPFVKRLHRTALIITGNPRAASKLLQKMYRKAWSSYKATDDIRDFTHWLANLMSQNFVLKPQGQ